MVELFVCCSPPDLEIAAAVASRLERTAETAVVIDARGNESVAARWEGGLSSSAILLLLSPQAVPRSVSRAEWGPLLDHTTSNAEPPAGFLLIGECGYPRLLERKHFFRWDGGSPLALRRIEKWIMRLHRLPERPSFIPARLPWLEDRQRELAALWETLVDKVGIAAVRHPASGGKTSLAQGFARQAGGHFRDTLWVACGDRSCASITEDLAEDLGIHCENGSEADLAALLEVAGRHRLLLIFDDVRSGFRIPVAQDTLASVLITTRSDEVGESHRAETIRIEDAPSVALDIPQDPVLVKLWRAMAVCRASGFPLELAAEIAELERDDAAAACGLLIEKRLADPFDQAEGRLRLSAASLLAAESGGVEAYSRRHAEVVYAALEGWTTNADKAKRYTPELMPAFLWAASSDWRLAIKLARKAYAYLRTRGRLAEGVEYLTALREAAELREDWEVSDECSWELSWVFNKPYRSADRSPLQGDQLSFNFGGSG